MIIDTNTTTVNCNMQICNSACALNNSFISSIGSIIYQNRQFDPDDEK